MNSDQYQTIERFWCKVTDSNDFISQGACWVRFESQFPPNSGKLEELGNGIGQLIFWGILISVAVKAIGALRSPRKPARDAAKREPWL